MFREREATTLRRNDLVFPLHYISIDNLNVSRREDCHDPKVLDFLRSRQWVDFRILRLKNPESEDVAVKVEAIADAICSALRRAGSHQEALVTQTPSRADPETPKVRQEAEVVADAVLKGPESWAKIPDHELPEAEPIANEEPRRQTAARSPEAAPHGAYQRRWTIGSFVGVLLIGLGLWYWLGAPPIFEPSSHSINPSPPPITPTQTTNAPGPVTQAEAPAAAQKNPAQENIVNLLSPEQGGQLLAAPDESWRKLTSGKEDDYVHYRSGPEAEAVYAFKDKKPATFGKLEILIKGTDEFNPKEIEILAGNDWPDGTFRPVTKCTFMNQLMMEARYQQCGFPETTARFVKIRLLSSFHFNDWANLPQIRLLGRSVQ